MSTETIAKLPAEAVERLRESHICAPLTHLAVIKASAPAIRDYLQGQITQDITRLAADRGLYSAVLTPQGKAVTDMRLLAAHNDELIIISEAAKAEALVGRLRRFALGFNVRIGIVDTLDVIAVQGPDTDAALSSAGLPLPASQVNDVAAHATDDVFSLRLPMAAADGVWIVTAKADVASCLQGLGHAIDASEMETARILRGFARFGIDWDEATHPLNANLIERHGVSFDKGCYLGQEVTSRMHWRGQIKWRLYRVGLEAAIASLPCAVEADGKMGEITSLARTADDEARGIALLRLEAVEAKRELHVAGAALRVLGHVLPV
ncbi:MAG: folate-binding protein [Mariprofundaceae bacterium]